MPLPLHQAKAELFRILGHPVRIRVLELLQAGPTPVRDLLAELDVEPSSLSQQLAQLRRARLVTATREGSTVIYALAGADVADLLRAARRILTELLTDQGALLAELRAADRSARSRPDPASGPATTSTAVPSPARDRTPGVRGTPVPGPPVPGPTVPSGRSVPSGRWPAPGTPGAGCTAGH